jgi:hypothetical protein
VAPKDFLDTTFNADILAGYSIDYMTIFMYKSINRFEVLRISGTE